MLDEAGRWRPAVLIGVLDDASRLACHVQWYYAEQARTFVHALSQALQKHGLPRALMTDNGSAETAAEVTEGLARLGIVHQTTLPYSAYQNAKQESFWGRVEGRLMAMLEGVEPLTLHALNDATLAWVEREYNRAEHGELGCAPLTRAMAGPDVSRECPDATTLRHAFRADITRKQRRSDGTCTVAGVRFEVPARYRHLRTPAPAPRALGQHQRRPDRPPHRRRRRGAVSARQAAQRRVRPPRADADRRCRRAMPGTPASAPRATEMAPLLKRLMAEYAATGLPPAYLPFDDTEPEDHDP